MKSAAYPFEVIERCVAILRGRTKTIEPQQGEADELGRTIVQFDAHAPQNHIVYLYRPAMALLDSAPKVCVLLEQARALGTPIARRALMGSDLIATLSNDRYQKSGHPQLDEGNGYLWNPAASPSGEEG